MTRLVLNDGAPVGADDPGPVAERLQGAMLAALGGHADARGHVDYTRLATSVPFAVARRAAGDLAGVRLAALDDRASRLAFWLNVYNALVLHAIVRLGVRTSVLWMWNFFGRVSYRIDVLVFSLDDIEHGVLRCNRRRKRRPRCSPTARSSTRRQPTSSPPPVRATRRSCA